MLLYFKLYKTPGQRQQCDQSFCPLAVIIFCTDTVGSWVVTRAYKVEKVRGEEEGWPLHHRRTLCGIGAFSKLCADLVRKSAHTAHVT